MVCVGVFSTSSSSKGQTAGESKPDNTIDIEAGMRPCSEVLDISASAISKTTCALPDSSLSGSMDKADFVEVSMYGNIPAARVSVDRATVNTPKIPSSLTAPITIPTGTLPIQIKVTKARTLEHSATRAAPPSPPQESRNLFHGKSRSRAEEEIRNEKTRNRVSSQRQSIVDPVKARILDVAMKQVQDRTVSVHKKVVITTPAIKITPSSVRIEYCQPSLFYSCDDQDKSTDTLISKSDAVTIVHTSTDEEDNDSMKSKKRQGIQFTQPPTIFSQLNNPHHKQNSMKIILPIIVEPVQIPTPPSSVSGSSINSTQSNESIQDIISMFPIPPDSPPPALLSEEEEVDTHTTDDLQRHDVPYTGSTILPSSSSESSSILDISISSEGDHSCESGSSMSEERPSPTSTAVETTQLPITKQVDAYYPSGVFGKSKLETGERQSSLPFQFPALPHTPPKPHEATHDRKYSNHLRPTSGDWLAKYTKSSSSPQSGRESFASQISVSASISVSGLSVFTEQYHDVVDTFNKAVEDNRRKGGAFHFNQDSLSAVMSSSKDRKVTDGAGDESTDEEKELPEANSSGLPVSESESTHDAGSEETSSDNEFTYKSSLRKRPDSLVWFAALDEARAQEQAQQRASGWETDLESDLSDEEYASTAALAVATPHQVEKPVTPLNVVKKTRRQSSSLVDEGSPVFESPSNSESSCVTGNQEEDDRGQKVVRRLDEEDVHEASSDETWFSSDSSLAHRRANGNATMSVTTLHTPELDANDVFSHADESIDSTERSIDDILGMLDRQSVDGVKISGADSPTSPQQHSQVIVQTDQRTLGSVSFTGAPAGLRSLLSGKGTGSIGVHSMASAGRMSKRRTRRTPGSPWRKRAHVAEEEDEDEDEVEEGDVEECWGELFSEAKR
ncbi:hypothetical protein CVT24_011904 [Panaeolus cyanescens]|uniref:Uncharacterized protein n=1 Tax=Panaeolus cyanescens TaxID=181874 RepID=A0A409YNL6_9AGAR|nr:hypothetical protein CVT24_011904 [Panaeolus cyanescens]